MTNTRTASLLAALVALPTLSFAGTEAKPAAAAPAEKINSSAITGDIGFQVMSTSYSRGSILGNHGPTLLPYIDLYAAAYEGDGFINKVSLSLNVTEYFMHPDLSGFAKNVGNAAWYENDFIPGIAFTSGKFTLSESFHWYTIPNDTAPTFEGLNSSLSYDDSDALGAFALHPAVTFLKNTKGKGFYYEFAVGPGFSSGPLAVGFPITVGFNGDKFGAGFGATKDGFAFASAGIKLTYTLPIPKTYGTWSANTGVTFLTKDKKVVGGRENGDVILSGGMMVAF